MKIKSFLAAFALLLSYGTHAADKPSRSPTPPMGWMSWNLMETNVTEKGIQQIADALVSSGMAKAGYRYIVIDDGWQGGRDATNQIIADPVKFPSGIKALAAYVHERGLKLGIYSDAAQLTCAGYTGSLHFEELDAKTFAAWDIDYLKYDYCNAPEDAGTAQQRYRVMADALTATGREIVFAVCEWGDRQPWKWAGAVGGQLWRTTADIRDKWQRLASEERGAGVLDIFDINIELSAFSSKGKWNDPDMLVVGLYGFEGPSAALGGIGMNDIEYQSQFSLWAMMNAPLFTSNDLGNLNAASKNILLNTEIIAVNQDEMAQQAVRKIHGPNWDVLLKPLSNGDFAVAILNRSQHAGDYRIDWRSLGLRGNYQVRDLWSHQNLGNKTSWHGKLEKHETKVFRLSPLASK